jgi:hypothetical protein
MYGYQCAYQTQHFVRPFTLLAHVHGLDYSLSLRYLVADDMRPQLGCYGHDFMKTPNLDNLSATGLHFDFGYTNFAYCAPSRNSFMR